MQTYNVKTKNFRRYRIHKMQLPEVLFSFSYFAFTVSPHTDSTNSTNMALDQENHSLVNL